MITKLISGLGARAGLAVTLLAAVVAANVLVQLYMHKTTALTAWKGGGFGMYTEPHGEDRSVWIELSGETGAAWVRMWPPTDEFSQWHQSAGVSGRAYLAAFQRSAERMRFFPRASRADDLVARAARLRWPETLVGEVAPAQGRVSAPEALRVVVYENRYDTDAALVVRRPIYEFRGARP